MKKILIFFDYFYPAYKAGGPIKSGLNILSLLNLLEADFEIITRDTDIDGTVVDDQNRLDCVTYSRYNLIFVFRQIMRRDVIILNSVFSVRYSMIPLFIATFLLKPVFLFPRGELSAAALNLGKSRFKKLYLSLLTKKGSLKLFLTSEEEMNLARKLFKDRQIQMFPNFRLDLLKSSNQYVQVENESEFDFGIIGRIAPIKNQLQIIEVFKNLKSSLLVKGPPENQQYSQQCKQAVSKNVKYEEFAETDVNEFFKRIRCLIIPSLSENYCHVLYEALAFGIPVILSSGVHQSFYPSMHLVNLKDNTDLINKINMMKNYSRSDLFALSRELHKTIKQELNRQYELSRTTLLNSNILKNV